MIRHLATAIFAVVVFCCPARVFAQSSTGETSTYSDAMPRKSKAHAVTGPRHHAKPRHHKKGHAAKHEKAGAAGGSKAN